jgi:hypothetical protein
MTPVLLMLFAAFMFWPAGVVQAVQNRQNAPDPLPLYEIDFDVPRNQKGEWIVFPAPGYLIEICVGLHATQEEKLKRPIATLKVEIDGDAIATVAIVTRPVDRLGHNSRSEESRQPACYLKLVKTGKARIKVTPIGADGKARSSQEWRFHVGEKKAVSLQDEWTHPECMWPPCSIKTIPIMALLGVNSFQFPIVAALAIAKPSRNMRGQINNAMPAPFTQIEVDPPRRLNFTGSNYSPGHEFYVSNPGSLFQFFLLRSTVDPNAAIRTVRVEITGDAVELIGVITIPNWVKRRKQRIEVIDPSKKIFSCFIKAVKKGKASIKITPIGEDGKARASTEWRFRVDNQAAARKKAKAK